MQPAIVKQVLDEAILKVTATPSAYVYNPEKDFSRNRKLPFQAVIKMLVGIGRKQSKKRVMGLIWIFRQDSIYISICATKK